MPGKRQSDAIIEERIDKIFELVVDGLPRRLILEIVKKKTDWGIEVAQIDNYIRKATARLKAIGQVHREEEINKAIIRLNSLFYLAKNDKDYRAAIAAQKELTSLLGLAAPTKLEHTGANGGPIVVDGTSIAKALITERNNKKE